MKMKNFNRSLLLSSLACIGLASLAYAATPSMEVTVSNSAKKVVYQGRTDASGAFTTPSLAPGNYVVLFTTKSSPKGGPFSLIVTAGKQETSADSLPGGKFAQGGVAMAIKVNTAMSLRGQITGGGAKAAMRAGSATASAASHPDGETMENGKRVKYTSGKKFVWVPTTIAAGSSGHWASADSAEGRNALAPTTTTKY
jgi:hypothetical protein